MITHLLYLNTLAFLCYDLTIQNVIRSIPYWITLGVIAIVAPFNNWHGNNIMRTTASTAWTKLYFVMRTLLQLAYLYVSLTLVCGYDLSWGRKLTMTENKNEIEELRVICAVVAVFSSVVYVILLRTASTLIKIQSKTEFDMIRN